MGSLNKRVENIETILKPVCCNDDLQHLTDEELNVLIQTYEHELSHEEGVTSAEVSIALTAAILQSHSMAESLAKYEANIEKIKSSEGNTMNIQKRVVQLEDRIGIGQKTETLEEMLEAFGAGRYGQATVMSIVAGAMSAPDKGQYFDGLHQQLPGPLVDLFRESIGKIQAATA